MPTSIVNMIVEAILNQVKNLITADEISKIEQAALAYASDQIAKLISLDTIHKIEGSLITQLRALAKTATPNFPYDDQLVELLAKAMGVP